MSFAIDVNLLLYASDSSSPHGPRARQFLDACAAGDEPLCLAWPTILGYLRMATHPSIFESPLAPDVAEANVAALLGLPHARVLTEEEGFWDVYREVTRDHPARGNAVPDAHLAAILRQHAVRVLFTNDSDFRRYPFLEVRNPLAEK